MILRKRNVRKINLPDRDITVVHREIKIKDVDSGREKVIHNVTVLETGLQVGSSNEALAMRKAVSYEYERDNRG